MGKCGKSWRRVDHARPPVQLTVHTVMCVQLCRVIGTCSFGRFLRRKPRAAPSRLPWFNKFPSASAPCSATASGCDARVSLGHGQAHPAHMSGRLHDESAGRVAPVARHTLSPPGILATLNGQSHLPVCISLGAPSANQHLMAAAWASSTRRASATAGAASKRTKYVSSRCCSRGTCSN